MLIIILMRKFCLGLMSILIFSSASYAKITTKEDAKAFLNEYCIELVNGISDAYESQIIATSEKDWETFKKQGRWIIALADVYHKVCK